MKTPGTELSLSVIISTYNSPDYLENVLWGYAQQTHRDFEMVIADDGSGQETTDRIEAMREKTGLEIQHVWQEDDGFRKCQILNKAIVAANGNYLIMTDGDCVPREDFVAVHARLAEPGYYLSGGYYKLPMETSRQIDTEVIASGKAFDIDWLRAHGLPRKAKRAKLTAGPVSGTLLDFLIPTKRTWNGHNSSGWKQDVLAVNGFDERMQYGGQDCEMGYRLSHSGIKAKRIRYRAICIHLDHSRGYVTPEMVAHSRSVIDETLRTRSTQTAHGIAQNTA